MHATRLELEGTRRFAHRSPRLASPCFVPVHRAHFVLAYVYVLWGMWLLAWHYRQFAIIRTHYLRRGERAPAARACKQSTVMSVWECGRAINGLVGRLAAARR